MKGLQKGLLRMLKLVAAIVLGVSSLTLQALELKGNLTQGGLVMGSLAGSHDVYLNDTPLKLTSKGEFVFGFGRDSELEHVLRWTDKNGNKQQKKILITKRDYKIDKITGVAQKYVTPPESVSKRIATEAAAVKKARANVSARTDFLNPVYRPAEGRISGVYGSQRYFNGVAKTPHFGLDIANKKGTPVLAPLSGKVVFANPDLYYSGGTLILDHGHGVTSTYIHLHTLNVKEGQEVKLGDKIAEIGATGRVTGPHLDWRFNWMQERLDPALLMIDTIAK
jgi:murein DD-endopeptidase MepM/ murein hydrolase activator NlpD